MEMKKAIELIYLNHDDDIKEYEILKKFKSHNILRERVDLYRDFSLNLLYKIYNTYLGFEYINNKNDAIGHYNWCFAKILEEFDEQEIDFYRNDELYDYFLEYYLNQFYGLKNQTTINFYKKIWTDIFDHKKSNKSKNEFEVLVELYHIFDISLDNKHKIEELI